MTKPRPDPWQDLLALAKKEGWVVVSPGWLGAARKHEFYNPTTQKQYFGSPSHLFKRGRFPLAEYAISKAERLKALKALARKSDFEVLLDEWPSRTAKVKFRKVKTGEEFQWCIDQILTQGFPRRVL